MRKFHFLILYLVVRLLYAAMTWLLLEPILFEVPFRLLPDTIDFEPEQEHSVIHYNQTPCHYATFNRPSSYCTSKPN
jgi:hypothetical protein